MSETIIPLAFIVYYGIPVVVLIAVLGFVISLWKKDNSIADVLYAWHFMMLASIALALSFLLASYVGRFPTLSCLLAFLVVLWGLRLSFRIYAKNKGKPEDFRYASWRANWKWFKTRSFFQMQGIIALVIVSPIVLAILFTPTKLTAVIVVGIIIWLKGFIFETIGDAQLDRFIKNPEHKGMLMTTGLWKFSRHPNYFGEALMWWGFWVISLSDAGDIWYITIISPLLITFLLVKVSGIPLLEARMSQHPDWTRYAQKTSKLIPWFPKKGEEPIGN